MRIQFCIAVVVLTVWTFGANGQKGSNGGFDLAHILMNSSHPQDFLSSVGSTQACPYKTPINCDATTKTIRTIDGSCNNAKSTYMGKSETPYIRIFPALYEKDGKPRVKSFFGELLPIPRKISNDYFKDTSKLSAVLTNLAAVFARFVEHDLYKTKLESASECCKASSSTGSCDNIVVESTDAYFSKYLRICLPKGKAVTSTALDCKPGSIQQINENTHYLDLSNIYGSTTAAANNLRTKTDGLLKESDSNNLLPKSDYTGCVLPIPNTKKMHCFLAGDLRANNDPLLMAMYTMWVREHNYIAKEIKSISPKATDETIYQTARKILIAQYQHIVYSEFLLALDSNTNLKPTGSSTVSSKPESEIANRFTIAFTGIVDSMVRKDFKFDTATIEMDKVWLNPQKLWETDGIKKLFKGMLADMAESIDRFMVKAISDKYLETVPGQGTDKVAVNIQQTRENGIPNYYIVNALLRKLYSVTDYSGFSELKGTAVADLKKLYPRVFDLEFLPGLLSEKITNDVQVGSLMKMIVDDQFKRLKEGDAFYYENNGLFTAARLAEIKKISMGKILCRHASQDKTRINVFRAIDTTTNKETDCTAATYPDLCTWATESWTDWAKTPCMGGMAIFSRQCMFLPNGKCKCTGSPFKFESCPDNLQNMISPDLINNFGLQYYSILDDQGHLLNGSTNAAAAVQKIFENVVHG